MKNKIPKDNTNDIKKVNRYVPVEDLFDNKNLKELSVIIQEFSEKYGEDAKIKIDYSGYDGKELALVYQDDENKEERIERFKREEMTRLNLRQREENDYKQYLKFKDRFGK